MITSGIVQFLVDFFEIKVSHYMDPASELASYLYNNFTCNVPLMIFIKIIKLCLVLLIVLVWKKKLLKNISDSNRQITCTLFACILIAIMIVTYPISYPYKFIKWID